MSAKSHKKPILSIEVNEEQNQGINDDSARILQATKSAKNTHQLKIFNFNQVRPYDKLKKQQKIDKLQRQKAQLLLSLEILKNGAVSAIQEKDQIINKLRKLFAQSQETHGQETNDSKMQQLQNLLKYIKDLQEDRAFLKDQAQRQRQIFQQAILQRQQIIQDLTNQLNWSNQRIQNLQKYQDLLTQKLQALSENNQNLRVMLNQSQQMLREEKKKQNQSSQLSKNKSSSSINVGSDSQNGSFLTKQLKKINNPGLNDSDFCVNISKSLDESIIQSRINEIKIQHQVEIQDLTDFYQSRIQTLKKLCQSCPQIQYSSSKNKDKSVKNNNQFPQPNQNNHQTTEDRSNYSNFTIETGQKQHILKKNLSLGSIKSGGFQRIMDPIDEKQQIQKLPTGRSLKKQLLSFQRYNRQPSDKSKHSSSSSSVTQKKSSFSNKFFEYPPSNFKKNKSIRSLKNTQQNTQTKIQTQSFRKHTEPSKQTYKQIVYNVSSFNPNLNKSRMMQKKEGGQFWDKFFWFTTGTLTGGLLLTVGHKIWK